MRKIDNNIVSGVLQDAAEGLLTIKEIAAKWEISAMSVTNIKRASTPVCLNCGRGLPIGSKFCNLCGSKVLTEKEQVVENLKKAAGLCAGSINADEIRQSIFAAVKFLEDK